MKLTRALLAPLALATMMAAHASAAPPSAPSPVPAAAAAPSVHLVVGQVLGIDASQRLLTVAHQDIPSMRMPAMTMDFAVHDSVDLSRVTTGRTFALVLTSLDDHLAVSALQVVEKTGPGSAEAAGGMDGMPGMKDARMPMNPDTGMMDECRRMMHGK